jgi:hypothetical protein
MTSANTSVCVEYKNAEDWHIFVSDDLPGLFIANKDKEKSFHDVSNAIEKLLLLNEGIVCKAMPEMTYQEFVKMAKEHKDSQELSTEPLVLSNKRFTIMQAAA